MNMSMSATNNSKRINQNHWRNSHRITLNRGGTGAYSSVVGFCGVSMEPIICFSGSAFSSMN